MVLAYKKSSPIQKSKDVIDIGTEASRSSLFETLLRDGAFSAQEHQKLPSGQGRYVTRRESHERIEGAVISACSWSFLSFTMGIKSLSIKPVERDLMPIARADDVEPFESVGGVPVPRSEGRGIARSVIPSSVRAILLWVAASSSLRSVVCRLPTKS